MTDSPTDAPTPDLAVSRRSLLALGATTAGAIALAGCSSASSGGAASTPGAAASSPSQAAGSASPTTPAASASASTAPATGALAKLADIPVGGAVSATSNGAPIIIAQPTAGTVVGFSAICTHMGCTVAVAGKQLDCPCHGSKYVATTGAVINGPAPAPLHPFAVKLSGTDVIVG